MLAEMVVTAAAEAARVEAGFREVCYGIEWGVWIDGAVLVTGAERLVVIWKKGLSSGHRAMLSVTMILAWRLTQATEPSDGAY